MTNKKTTGWIIFLLAFCVLSHNASAAHDTLELFQTHLYAGQMTLAEKELQEQLNNSDEDDQARFALGTVQFIQAVERLAQSMHRYGLRSSVEVFNIPFFRMPVVDNPTPEYLTYEKVRKVLQRFVTDLSVAERTLSLIEGNDVRLPLNIGLVRLDMNGDGDISKDETLWRIFQRIAPQRQITEEESRKFVVDFDRSDVPWLQGYCHLLMGLGEFLLAHDWHVAFEKTFHALFPNSGLPFSVLDENKNMNGLEQPHLPVDGILADLIAFVHLNHWPVIEPERMRSTLVHLEKMVTLSRANWDCILSEQDKENAEWIPNPNQTGVLPGMTVTQQRVDGWLLFLDEFEALLKGRKLLPHWRLAKGINLRRVFLEPETFDVILWIQGSAAVPYLEEGELMRRETWQTIFNLFQGNFFSYAIWFN